MLSSRSGPLGLGRAADTMVWGGVPGKWREQKTTGIERGCLVMLPKHPIIATATAVAVATDCHSPPLWSLRGFIVVVVVVVIITAVTTVFPPLFCDLFDCCICSVVVSSPLPHLVAIPAHRICHRCRCSHHSRRGHCRRRVVVVVITYYPPLCVSI